MCCGCAKMAVMEISVIPMGTSASVSGFVAGAVELIKKSGLRYRLTAMGTIVEGEVDQLLKLAGEVHKNVLDRGAPRVVTLIKLDDRKDKPLSAEGKIRSVQSKLEGLNAG